MATLDELKGIVRNGSNLILCRAIDPKALEEIAELARHSGAHLTLSTDLVDSTTMMELSGRYRESISFIHGLDVFKQK